MDFYNQKWVLWFKPEVFDNMAITLGQYCFYSVSKSQVSDRWRRHEDDHKRQYKKYWYIGFPVIFCFDWLVGRWNGLSSFEAYRATRFEVEARECENQ